MIDNLLRRVGVEIFGMRSAREFDLEPEFGNSWIGLASLWVDARSLDKSGAHEEYHCVFPEHHPVSEELEDLFPPRGSFIKLLRKTLEAPAHLPDPVLSLAHHVEDKGLQPTMHGAFLLVGIPDWFPRPVWGRRGAVAEESCAFAVDDLQKRNRATDNGARGGGSGIEICGIEVCSLANGKRTAKGEMRGGCEVWD